jgi:sarcosine dehydrogenase
MIINSKIIIVGGGIVGCSTAYHLAHLGLEVCLIESGKLTSGSTWHAAGLVGQLRTNANITQLLGYSVDLYNRLEKETGLSTGWKMNGGLRLACNKERWQEVLRQTTTAHSFGLQMELLTPKEAQDLWPIMDIEDVHGAAFLPTDGQANPTDISQALARGAKNKGAQILEETRVKKIILDDGIITGVETDKGIINCEKLVCCCGQWSRQFAETVGVNIPLVSFQHQYMVTEPIEGVVSNLPTLRDPDRLIYFKEEVGGLVMGGYEPNPISWAEKSVPEDFHFSLLDSDYDHFELIMNNALGRVPKLETAGIKELINGPESFTPDGNFILGESPELKNFYVGAGFNAYGIAAGGGAGMALAEWIANGAPPYDLWPVDIRRFGKPHQDLEWVRKRTYEAYAKHYTMAWPFEEHSSGRPFQQSPIYENLKNANACFGEKLGWERPNWFAPKSMKPVDHYTYDRQNWFEVVGEEVKATREKAVLIDQTSFAKFEISGSQALDALEYLCANNVNKEIGSTIYTQMLNNHGGIECDVTITRIEDDRFYLVTGTGFMTHDFDWIKSNLTEFPDVKIENVTYQKSVFSLMGPNSRSILEKVSSNDFSNEKFPFATAQSVNIGDKIVRAIRITYMGELGWELHFPIEDANYVYNKLFEVGEELGLVNAGYRCIEACRLEKGYRAWGSDIGPDHTPLEAGLGWAVKLKSNKDFMGKSALLDQKKNGVKKIFAAFTVEDPKHILLGRETIYRNGKQVGWLSSGGYGYTIKQSVGYGYIRSSEFIDNQFVLDGQYELEIATKMVPCMVHLKALYDSEMKKIKV